MSRLRGIAAVVVLASVALLPACSAKHKTLPVSPGNALIGTFQVTAGHCIGKTPAGSYFRMLQPNGKPATGPYVANGDSSCGDKTTTPLTPGSDGGLRTGGYQAQSGAAFDAHGNGNGGLIVKPQKWFAVAFGIATNAKDPQTKKATSVPNITLNGTQLTGDLSAVAASWNGQYFNQGAPKPGGVRPGNTAGPTGTYDTATKAYTLEWSSQIVGGPFNNFTGIWHLEGTFHAA